MRLHHSFGVLALSTASGLLGGCHTPASVNTAPGVHVTDRQPTRVGSAATDPTSAVDAAVVREPVTQWVSQAWPQWDPRATQVHAELCNPPQLAPLRATTQANGDTPQTPSGDVYNFESIGVGRGAQLPPNEYARYDRMLIDRCFEIPFWYSNADSGLGCTRSRLVTEAVRRRAPQVRSCSAGGEPITVVMDIRISANGRIFPLQASVAQRFVAMAQCVAERLSNAEGPSHSGEEDARARIVFRWTGPCR